MNEIIYGFQMLFESIAACLFIIWFFNGFDYKESFGWKLIGM